MKDFHWAPGYLCKADTLYRSLQLVVVQDKFVELCASEIGDRGDTFACDAGSCSKSFTSIPEGL